jgi:uncharacterized protein (DUF2236 family)
MKKLANVILSCAIFIAQGGCGTGQDVKAAEEQVTNFHQQLDSQDFLNIYNQADPKLREVTKTEEFLGLLTAVHKKLGNVQNATRQSFYVNFSTSGSTVRLTYQTKFAEGDAQEVFTWKKNGSDLRLLGYNIQSNALILK